MKNKERHSKHGHHYEINGIVAEFEFKMEMTYKNLAVEQMSKMNQELSLSQYNSQLFQSALEQRQRIQNEIEEIVSSELGNFYIVLPITIREGSTLIDICITTIKTLGAIYITTAKYKSFIDSIELIKKQIQGLLVRKFNNGNTLKLRVSNNSTIGNGITKVRRRKSRHKYHHIILMYLIASHAALLATIIYLLITHYGQH